LLEINFLKQKISKNLDEYHKTNNINNQIILVNKNIEFYKKNLIKIEKINLTQLNGLNLVNKKYGINIIQNKIMKLEELHKTLKLELQENNINYISEDIFHDNDNLNLNNKQWQKEFSKSIKSQSNSTKSTELEKKISIPKPFGTGNKYI
jgi:hypothetical protein